ncbi:TniQ family protein [Rhizobacter sp. J219]|uniref:TniQ family protein n=1 Tax=Rhizobacter sp. J219 TaxID=2898430 RepID=UPI0035B1DD8D
MRRVVDWRRRICRLPTRASAARFERRRTRMSRLVTLPVRVEPEADESGTGALLRSARANGLGLRYMVDWVGVGGLRVRSQERIAILADVVGIPVVWLRHNLGVECQRGAQRWFEWRGQCWTFSPSLRRTRIQYCPRCLRERSICRSAWEITGAFACERHRLLLSERCPHCKAMVSWDRPAPEVCRCGHYLSAADVAEVSEEQLEWVRTLLDSAGIGGACRSADGHELPRWFSALTADGLFSIVHAAGVKEDDGATPPRELSRCVPAPGEVAKIVERGIKRLQAIGELRRPCSTEMRSLLHEDGFERILRRNTQQADRDVTLDLLAWMRNRPKHGTSLTGRKARGQLRLFT